MYFNMCASREAPASDNLEEGAERQAFFSLYASHFSDMHHNSWHSENLTFENSGFQVVI